MSRKQDAKAFMEKAAGYGSVLGLSSITELMRQLDNPQDELQIIHVAGTNGKGSTITFLSNILQRAGYRVGVYTSPAVFDYRERFAINGAWIAEKELWEYLHIVEEACDAVVSQGGTHPTLFEIETALAFLYFAEEKCDYVLLEVGMGGKTDATNVISHSLCSVFTSIGRDHMQFLGENIGDIAKIKAGIIKKGGRGVSIWQESQVEETLSRVATEMGGVMSFAKRSQVTLMQEQTLVFSYKEFSEVRLQMAGTYQLDNAVLALEVVLNLRELGVEIPTEAVYLGMQEAFWPGRMECICHQPWVYLDGAHNLPAAVRLQETIGKNFTNKSITFIIGVLADKEHREMLRLLLPMAAHVVTVTPNNPRAYAAADLAEEIRSFGYDAYGSVSIKDGVSYAMEQSDDVVLAFGSLSYLQECKACVLQWTKEHENV
ncbi:MAG: bifunctional folylpolyglutamate synthase/dihydrofolate synthase [Lachnospiraceae bacterium]|nr:bifunctional folylpolyglutamate synthase/dihydrofolate synthase [Lachnospiraceae bacterium]